MLPASVLLLLLASGALARSTSVQQDGVLPPWESKTVLTNAQKQIHDVSDSLGALNTDRWKGDYGPLLVSTRQRVDAVADAVKRMADKPESLSLGLEAFLSMQSVEDNINSLAKGAERFQPSAVAGLENASGSFQQVKEQFQTYLLELSRYLEKNLAVSTKDLEICRDQVWKAAPKKKL